MNAPVARTNIAQQGFDLAIVFGARMAQRPIDAFEVRLVEPASDSTGAGAQSRQQLTLVPADTPDATLTVGTVDVATALVTLRTHACVGELYEARFGRTFGVTAEDYQRFFDAARGFFEEEGMRIQLQTHAPVPPSRAEPASSRKLWVALTLAAAAALAGLIGSFVAT